MKIAIISNEFPPLMSSGAVQVRDLAREFANKGHDVTVITATYGLEKSYCIEQYPGYRVVRFSAYRTKDVGYVRRTINEILTPLKMLRGLKKSSIDNTKWDGVVWYSPTIFLGSVACYLKKTSKCGGYLIVRDIFPDWAVDMGLIGKGLPYRVLKLFENYQYSVADVIGVQSRGNLPYFSEWDMKSNTKVEVLNNWLSHSGSTPSSITLADTCLAGRTIFIYAGNMGVAQGVEILFQLVLNLKERRDIGFLFVGRGSEMDRFRQDPTFNALDNVLFFDQINADEIPSLYKQCHAGLLSLDVRHQTHNIPGKFLSYIASGLPVLASLNPGNDLVSLINSRGIGRVVSDGRVLSLVDATNSLVDLINSDGVSRLSEDCVALSEALFQPEIAVQQIVAALEN
jgi:glycosyltransferase involved in cell wall biosynthesis